MNTLPEDKTIVPRFIRAAIQKEIEIVTNEEMTEAQKRIDERKSKIVATVLLNVTQNMMVEMMGEHIKLSIEFKK